MASNISELKEKSSEKVKQALVELQKIDTTLFNNFVKTDLVRLQIKNTPKAIMEYAHDADSAIYKFAAQLLKNDANMGNFETAIKKLSEGSNPSSLFYKYVRRNVEKLLESKDDIKLFLTTVKDPGEEPNTTTSHILNKLKKDNLSSILKAFIALVTWECINQSELAKNDEKNHKEIELEQWLYNKDSSGHLMPSPNDVDQNGSGKNNCYMLSVLVAMAEKDPEYIKNELIKLESDKIIVSLYNYEYKDPITPNENDSKYYNRKAKCVPKEKHRYELSQKDVQKYQSSSGDRANKHKANWVTVVEIAFVKLIQECHPDEFGKITSGTIDDVLSRKHYDHMAGVILTGNESKQYSIPEYEMRKRENKNYPKKFPKNAQYDDYCDTIRKRICKHIDAKDLVTISFYDNLHSSYIPKSIIYSKLKKNPELLSELVANPGIKEKLYKEFLAGHYEDFMGMLSKQKKFTDTRIFDDLLGTFMPYIVKNINEPRFKEFKNLADQDPHANPKSASFKAHLSQNLSANTRPLMDKNLASELRDNAITVDWGGETKKTPESYDQLIELLTNDSFTDTQYFDATLKETIAPFLSENLKESEFFESSKRKIGTIGNHAYAVLNCFQDKATKYWYVTLQNPWGAKSIIDYTKSKRLKTLTFPPDPKPGIQNVFNMELADCCKYLRSISYTTDQK